MYIPKQFKMDNADEIFEFIRQNAFGLLISVDGHKPMATHIPMSLDLTAEKAPILRGHISKANPQAALFQNNTTALAIFTGAHAYISSSWYAQENVSTWNYSAVHVYGQIRILDEQELWDAVENLTKNYESDMEKPLFVSDMSHKLMKSQIKGIVGFELQIEDIQAKAKLSQNRNEADFKNIVDRLEEMPDAQAQEVARQMRHLKNQ